MEKTVSDFALKNRVSVLTTLIGNGVPHSSTMHYSFSPTDGSFVFLTGAKSTKCKNLINNQVCPASLVIGFDEQEPTELQMRGNISIVKDEKELADLWETYLGKFAEKEKYRTSKDEVLLKFVPSWWRYTESKPKFKVIESK